jgi:aspartate/methionine/tyrosine aminotransferase
MYDGMEHYCLEDNHIVNLFSFSKAYGMMGWRVGYVSASYAPFILFLLFTTGDA